MGSSKIFSHTLLVGVLLLASFSRAYQQSLLQSSISASPAVLPFPPHPSTSPDVAQPPVFSPDVSPLFPTPGGSEATPPSTDSSLPIIPSSPSPPNPDGSVSSPSVENTISPTGSTLPESSVMGLNPSGPAMVVLILLLGVLV